MTLPKRYLKRKKKKTKETFETIIIKKRNPSKIQETKFESWFRDRNGRYPEECPEEDTKVDENKWNDHDTLARRTTPLQTNGEIREMRGRKRGKGSMRNMAGKDDKVERARMLRGTHDMWTTERDWYSSYPTSGSLLRRNEHDNPGQAEPRLWEKFCWKMRRCAWPRGGSAAARAFRSLSGNPSPFQCFPRWGCERASWVQGRCRTLSTLNFSCGYLLITYIRSLSPFIFHLPISFRRYQFFIQRVYYYIYI